MWMSGRDELCRSLKIRQNILFRITKLNSGEILTNGTNHTQNWLPIEINWRKNTQLITISVWFNLLNSTKLTKRLEKAFCFLIKKNNKYNHFIIEISLSFQPENKFDLTIQNTATTESEIVNWSAQTSKC